MADDDRDRRLVRRCLEGDERAFADLIDHYQKPLFNVALRMVGDHDDARDITQTALIKAFRKLDTYDPKHRFFSWIYRITVNESLNVLSRRERHEILDPDLILEQGSPEEEHRQARLAQRVQAAVMELPPDYRQVVILRHFVDLSYREVSSLMDIPEKTVKSRLYTARQQLRDILLGRKLGPKPART